MLVFAFICNAEEFSEEQFAQQMQANDRVMQNGTSYQVLKLCGADAETLKNIQIYLYKDINDALENYPEAKINIDGVFELGMAAGDDIYKISKDNAAFCQSYLKEAKVYLSK